MSYFFIKNKIGYPPEVERLLKQALHESNPRASKPSAQVERAESLYSIQQLFCPTSPDCWIMGLEQIQRPGKRKRADHDFILYPGPWTSLPFVNVMVVDEDYMRAFDGNKQTHGLTADEVRALNMVFLNGAWADASIVADLIAQTMNLQGIWNNEEEMHKMLHLLPPDIVQTYHAGYWPVEQYRANYFGWMNGSNTRPSFVDGYGVRRPSPDQKV